MTTVVIAPREPLFFRFEAPALHAGVQVEVRCKKHLPKKAQVVDSEEARRRYVGAWHKTIEYHPDHRCSKCVLR